MSSSDPGRGGDPTSRSRRRWARVSALVVLLLLGVPAIRASTGQRAPDEEPPNFVVFIADDQRWDSLWAMPEVQRRIADPGITFTDAYVVNPACCPSRTSLLTGRYSHSTGVWRNHGQHGGFAAFDDSSTIATWLDDAGYETALYGKYLNGYLHNTYVPPGWDQWMAFTGQAGRRTGNYYDYDLNVNGAIVHHPDQPGDYGTDVLAEEAVRFVRTATDPFFLVFSPPAPHYPALPAPRHVDAVADLAPWRPPAFNEQDVTDKPAWLSAEGPLDAEGVANLDELRLRQYQSLLALDEAVGRIVRSLRQTDQLDETVLLYVSDNGYLLGEHRLVGKAAPYEESIRVPFLLRYDALTGVAPASSEAVLNIDVAPTIAELASVAAPETDGMSLLPLITGSGSWSREAFLVEHLGHRGPDRTDTGVPTYCAVHTGEHVYVAYQHGVNDLYDLRRDPDQLHNLALQGHRRLEQRLRNLLRSLCDPPPPGFDRLS
ncbi:MAG: sulfatase family protein [Actinomycetota bacterium]